MVRPATRPVGRRWRATFLSPSSTGGRFTQRSTTLVELGAPRAVARRPSHRTASTLPRKPESSLACTVARNQQGEEIVHRDVAAHCPCALSSEQKRPERGVQVVPDGGELPEGAEGGAVERVGGIPLDGNLIADLGQ